MKVLKYLLMLFLLVFLSAYKESPKKIELKNNKNNISILLPLYSYPTKWNINKIKRMKTKSSNLITIINPNNGPGKKALNDYKNAVRTLNKNSILVIGYVYTKYGNRDKSLIFKDIDNWSKFYKNSGLSGIFLDEVKLSSKNKIKFYKEIHDYVKNKGFDLVILNPGMKVKQSILNKNYFDIIVSFENSQKEWNKYKNKLKSTKTKQALLVYEVNKINIEKEIIKAKKSGYDYMYFTKDKNPNPWDTIEEFIN